MTASISARNRSRRVTLPFWLHAIPANVRCSPIPNLPTHRSTHAPSTTSSDLRRASLAALRAEVHPLAVAAQEGGACLADRRVAPDGGAFVHAGPITLGRAHRRVPDGARNGQAVPRAVLTAELGAVLAARGA